ncbi:MAG: methyltransferase domain-containing protein [Gammaproteobacteria bacterium]|nr:methyltransferase domain-containing protein [Gammaproteobacteria bacterium]
MSAEVRMHWHDQDVTFVDRLVVRDAPDLPDGEFGIGDLVPAWDASQVREIPLAEMALRRRYGPPLSLYDGRFYPRRLAGTTLSDGDGMQPMRVLKVHDDRVRVDLNAPLARFPVRVEVVGSQWASALDAEPLSTLITAGVGMQAKPPEAGRVTWLDEHALRCEDEADDAQFYGPARLVHHLDANARALLAARYDEELRPGVQVLDLMSSWTSHLPGKPADVHVVGLGMNAEELAANPDLAERVRHDLNRQPTLPFDTARFDLVLCSVSIEYLREPIAVLADVARVLKPGGRVVIAFSDRWFPTKAVRVWSELHPFQRPALVLHYLRKAGGFADYRAESTQGVARPADDRYAAQRRSSDPLFVVSATRI